MRNTSHVFHALAFACVAWLLAAAAPAAAQTPLDPNLIPKFATPLPLPGALDGTATTPASPLVITMSEFQQPILPASFYPAGFSGTYVWGYNGSYPGPTIVARRGVPTHVKYVNELRNLDGSPLYLQGTIQVDQTIHWANPLGTPHSNEPYMGPVPACVHLHGGEVPSVYDGGPDAWWTPGHQQLGLGYVTDQYAYPNDQEAMTMFYHDHALGMTRTNVYSGLAGFYLLLDPAGEPADLPGGPADHAADQYGQPYQIGLAFQDRQFDTNGQLLFPHEGINPEHPIWVPEFFGDVILVNGKPWPYLSVEPRRYRFRFLNGSNARFYRFLLGEAGEAAPAMWQIGTDGGLLDGPVRVSDNLAAEGLRLVMAPGERTDVVIDFSGFAGQDFVLHNDANTPFPDGDEIDPANTGVLMQFRVGTTVTGGSDPTLDPSAVATLRPAPIERPAAPPITRALTLNEEMGEGGPLAMFVNNTMWDMAITEMPRVGDTEVWEIINLTMDTHPMHLHLLQFQLLDRQPFDVMAYMEAYGMPMPGMGPPLPYGAANAATGFKLGGNPDVTPFLTGPATPPDANEMGWKDTYRMNPGEVSRILVRVAPQDANARAAAHLPPLTVESGVNLFSFEPWVELGHTDAFGYPGGPGYVWHCHIIDHEDNEMMRPLLVAGPQPPVATLLARFDAAATDGAVRVTWEATDPARFASVTLERGASAAGPWSAVQGERTAQGAAVVVTDRAVSAGSTYWYRLSAVLSDGTTTVFGPVSAALAQRLAFALGPVSPNPTNGPVRVDFSVARRSPVRLSLHDVQGRTVAVLARGEREAGAYSALWDGVGDGGRAPAGMYFLRYETPERTFTRRIAITR